MIVESSCLFYPQLIVLIISVEELINFKNIVQFSFKTCFYLVYYLILTEPHTNKLQVSI